MTSKQSIKTKSFYLLVYNIVHPPKTPPPRPAKKKINNIKKTHLPQQKVNVNSTICYLFPNIYHIPLIKPHLGTLDGKRERGGQGTCDGLICFCIGQGREERINTSNTQPFNFSSYLF